MASSLYNLALDFSKELNYTKAIMARQGDKGITVTVKPFLNGLQMDTSGGTFTLKGTTPSNRYVDNVATSVTSEEVTFSLDGTFMSEAGYYKHCYVEYRKDNQILTTQDIIFFSLGVSDISQGQADEYVSQLEELIRKYNETFDAFMAETKGRVDSLNQQITDLTGQAKTLQDKLDALKEEISKLGNLQVMYSNSIDFGGYDYSGNPNLSAKLNASSFSSGTGATVADDNDEIVFTLDGTNQLSKYTLRTQTPLVEGKQYTISCEIMLETGFTGDPSGIKLLHSYLPGGITTLQTDTVPKNELNKWQKLIGTRTVTYGSSLPNEWYPVFKDIRNLKPSGKVRVRNIKIEEGSTATPYQPNLLDAPYYLSKVALGDNLVTNARFPIKTSSNPISGFDISEELIIGETYTVSLKGTKPANKEFQLYYGDAGNFQAALQPAEGLKDVWSATFTAKNTTGTTNLLRVALWQMPTTVTNGDVQIDWLKIEKGDTRTPNIEQYKYRGIGMRDSNNPKDYVWDLAPEYVEDNLATDIKVAEITGKANNYTDGKVSQINSQLTASINAVDTTAKDAQTKANANATAIKSTNSRVDEIDRIITALTKEETYLLPASIVSGGSLKFTSRGGMTVATGSFKLAKDIAFGEVLVDDLPDSMINIDNNAIGTGAVTGNSVSQIYVESNTRKVVANTAMKKDQWFTVGFSYHSKLSI
ncbi:BppU family phage baseplate upper protein [Enterococcus faecium]|uniref:BppU family phage baseplate upper protein n=3 Tax=Enterococcus faecium TaxID=1352 RepID=UPI001F619D2E|nr:BppU family phage baseplate upper protein [Enterococcus faecium]UNS61620.1 BppU family phage baseplate upper protein [Enterococcus faecium]